MFHVNQVWTGGENAVPLVSCINRLLSQCLPVGAPVMVNFRPLPASLGSKLKYQATCLWPYLSEGAQNDQLLPQYIDRYIEREGWRRHSSLIFLILLFTKPNIEVSGWLYQTKTHFTHIVYQPFSRVSPPSFTLYG